MVEIWLSVRRGLLDRLGICPSTCNCAASGASSTLLRAVPWVDKASYRENLRLAHVKKKKRMKAPRQTSSGIWRYRQRKEHLEDAGHTQRRNCPLFELFPLELLVPLLPVPLLPVPNCLLHKPILSPIGLPWTMPKPREQVRMSNRMSVTRRG